MKYLRDGQRRKELGQTGQDEKNSEIGYSLSWLRAGKLKRTRLFSPQNYNQIGGRLKCNWSQLLNWIFPFACQVRSRKLPAQDIRLQWIRTSTVANSLIETRESYKFIYALTSGIQKTAALTSSEMGSDLGSRRSRKEESEQPSFTYHLYYHNKHAPLATQSICLPRSIQVDLSSRRTGESSCSTYPIWHHNQVQ